MNVIVSYFFIRDCMEIIKLVRWTEPYVLLC